MKRKITRILENWKNNPNKVGMIIKGARQIGKTYSINEFGLENYTNYVRLDMMETSNHIIFDDVNADNILFRLISTHPNFDPSKGNSLIFIDEIQECPEAILAMKYLVVDGRVDVIGTGSLLGIDYKAPRSYPIGYVEEKMMYPMDFEEYLWALGLPEEHTDYVREHVRTKTPMDPGVLKILTDYYRQYLIIGGMPEAVSGFLRNKTLGPLSDILDKIISGYRKDIKAYSKMNMQALTERMFDMIPHELARSNKRFRFTDIENRSNVGIREYEEPIDWLEGSWFVTPCYRLRTIARPLKANINRGMFKLYTLDTGILIQMYGTPTRAAIASDDISINEGAIAENSVCGMLTACGIKPFYYEKEKEVEIDFIAEIGVDLCAIEVKSGKKRRARSLKKMMEMEVGKEITRWIKFEYHNIEVTPDGVEHYPLFCAAFADELSKEPEIVLKTYDGSLDAMLKGDGARPRIGTP